MRILRDPAQCGPCVLVLGMFDGVHRGHGALLTRGRELADQTGLPLHVCTFEPHPLRVLKPEASPPLLTTLTERARRMADYGVDALCVTRFTPAVAQESPAAFMSALNAVYRPRWVVCGFNYTFGRGGVGDGEALKDFGKQHGFRVCVVPEVVIDGDTVSATRIRRLLAQGDIPAVTRLMGRPYALSGRVMDGKHIGRTLGFPTANVQVNPHKALPAFGVYACWLQAEGQVYPAVVNIGRHPTLPAGQVTVEAHVIDRCLNLYGKKVRLALLAHLRPERCFDGVDALRSQITRDADEARAFFAAMA